MLVRVGDEKVGTSREAWKGGELAEEWLRDGSARVLDLILWESWR
jgi:hypothetical protein